MKILKYIFIGLIVLIALLLLLGLFLPKTFAIERSIVIHSSIENVRKKTSSLKSLYEWSPWSDYDPQMKILFEGIDGQPGSLYRWEGNSKVGKGSQELIFVGLNRVETKVTFEKPWESEAVSYISLDSIPGGTEVSWGFTGKSSYPWNTFTVFMDKMVGEDFEKGLGNLKDLCEEN